MSAVWRPGATLAALRLRARLYAMIRGFFDTRGVSRAPGVVRL